MQTINYGLHYLLNLSGTLDTNIQRKFLVHKCKINTTEKGKQKFHYVEQLSTEGKKTKVKKEDGYLYVEESSATFKCSSQRLVYFYQITKYYNTKYRSMVGVLLRLDMETLSPEWRIQPRLYDSTERTTEACKQIHSQQPLLHTHPSSSNT